jgi:hypothetical protein
MDSRQIKKWQKWTERKKDKVDKCLLSTQQHRERILWTRILLLSWLSKQHFFTILFYLVSFQSLVAFYEYVCYLGRPFCMKERGKFFPSSLSPPPILITAWCQKLRPLFILTSNCYCFSQCAFDFLLEGSQLKHFGWKSIEISHPKCLRNKFHILVVNLFMIWMILCQFKKASVKSGHWIVITIVCVWYPEIIVVRDSTYSKWSVNSCL